MRSTGLYGNARSRAEAKYRFFVHSIVYGAVIGFLVMINLINWEGVFWSIWPMLGWGLALALHAARVFLVADKESIIDALTEDELNNSSGHNPGDRA